MMSEDGPELSNDHGVGEANLGDLYRAFILIDKLQKRYIDKRPDEKVNSMNKIDSKKVSQPSET